MFTRAGPTSLGCDFVWGGGVLEGTMALALLSDGFQSLPLLPTRKLGSSGADSRVGGLCTFWDPMGLSNKLCCEAGVSPAAASTPTGVFNQRFEALFP